MPSIAQVTPARQPLRNLNHSHVVRTPGRRSLVTGSTPLVKLANNDDEERLQRRTSIILQHRISNVPQANRSSASDHSELSDSKLQDHFQTCLRMFTQNKINTKNAWNLQIIEFMRKLVDREFSSGESIQLASTSLDIGSKVYGLRVDDIHQDILKLATTMGRISLDAEHAGEDASDGAEEAHEDAEGEARKKRERRPRKRFSFGDDNATTLAARPESLEATVAVHNIEYKLRQGDGNRLYTLAALRTQRFGYEALVRNRSNVPHWSSTVDRPQGSDPVGLELLAAAGTLCPAFADFVVDQWDASSEEPLERTQEPFDSVVYDADGYAMPELDRSAVNDAGAADDDQLSEAEEEEVGGVAHGGLRAEVAHITDMRPGSAVSTVTTNGLEYSYRAAPLVSDRYMMTGVWAGPAHWKVKCLRPSRDAEDKGAAQARGARKRSQRDADIDMGLSDADMEVYSIVGRKVNIAKALADVDYERLYLPADLSVTQQTCMALFLRPLFATADPKTVRTEENTIELNIADYQYDNPIDAEYCNRTLISGPEGLVDDDADDDNANSFDGAADGDADPMNDSCADADMVDVPNLVAKAAVPYSTQAKKMDMRKLKEAILRTLVEQNNADACADEELLRTPTFSGVSFCRMYEALPNHLSSRMADELSCPLAFVALLHLCNERALELTGQDDLLDVLINTT